MDRIIIHRRRSQRSRDGVLSRQSRIETPRAGTARVAGGACVTEEFHPGFRASTLAQTTGPLSAQVIKDLQLDRRGLS